MTDVSNKALETFKDYYLKRDTQTGSVTVLSNDLLVEQENSDTSNLSVSAGGIVINRANEEDVYISPEGELQKVEITQGFERRLQTNYEGRTTEEIIEDIILNQLDINNPNTSYLKSYSESKNVNDLQILLDIKDRLSNLLNEGLSGFAVSTILGKKSHGYKYASELMNHYIEGSGEDYQLSSKHMNYLLSNPEFQSTLDKEIEGLKAQTEGMNNGIIKSSMDSSASYPRAFLGNFDFYVEAKVESGQIVEHRAVIVDAYDWHPEVEDLVFSAPKEFIRIAINSSWLPEDLMDRIQQEGSYQMYDGLQFSSSDGDEKIAINIHNGLIQDLEHPEVGAKPFKVYGISEWTPVIDGNYI